LLQTSVIVSYFPTIYMSCYLVHPDIFSYKQQKLLSELFIINYCLFVKDFRSISVSTVILQSNVFEDIFNEHQLGALFYWRGKDQSIWLKYSGAILAFLLYEMTFRQGWKCRTPTLCHNCVSDLFRYFKSTIDLCYGIVARLQPT
jgi:hypothetical protein